MPSLSAALGDVVERLPSQLVPEPALARLRAAGDALPAVLTQSVVFECRLPPKPAPDAPTTDCAVDLSVCVPPGVSVRRHLAARRCPAPSSPAETASSARWRRRVGAVCRDWLQDARAPLRNLWIEIDLGGGQRRTRPQANLLVRLRPDATLAQGMVWLERLQSRPPSPVQRRLLTRCLTSLPAGAWTSGMGVMLQRRTQPTQVFLRGTSPSGMGALLQHVEWPGSQAQVRQWRAVLDRATAGVPVRHTLAVTTTDAVHADFAAETRVAAPTLSGQVSGWTRVLGGLVDQNLLSLRTAHALQHWMGGRVVHMPHVWWPLARIRTINHLKIRVTAAGNLTIKVYLAIRHRGLQTQ